LVAINAKPVHLVCVLSASQANPSANADIFWLHVREQVHIFAVISVGLEECQWLFSVAGIVTMMSAKNVLLTNYESYIFEIQMNFGPMKKFFSKDV